MPEIFELPELVIYSQKPDLDDTTAALARQLATINIRNEVGGARYDALTDLTPFKPIALEAASRSLLPPGVASEAIDDYRVAYRVSVSGAELTAQERTDIRAIGGRSSAYSVTPAAPSMCPPVYPPMPWRRRTHYL